MKEKIRVGINGFGRIGRCFARAVLADENSPLDIVLINDLGSVTSMAHLLEYDSIHGKFSREVWPAERSLQISDKGSPSGHAEIPVSSVANPSEIPWKDFGADIVLEATGKFKTAGDAEGHLSAGAGLVIISAVPADSGVKTLVMGANQELLTPEDRIISNASCTTNCAAPMVEIIDRICGVESGYITTVHSYTGDQTLHDTAHRDLRRARAAALSIIPTSTGAAKAITKIFPRLDGKLGGAGIRVPVPNGSLTDITFHVRKPQAAEALNEIFRQEAESGPWRGYLEYTEKPLVSIDIIGNPHSCVFDALLTSVIGNTVKVVGWYDNEMGYTRRLIDLILFRQGLPGV